MANSGFGIWAFFLSGFLEVTHGFEARGLWQDAEAPHLGDDDGWDLQAWSLKYMGSMREGRRVEGGSFRFWLARLFA